MKLIKCKKPRSISGFSISSSSLSESDSKPPQNNKEKSTISPSKRKNNSHHQNPSNGPKPIALNQEVLDSFTKRVHTIKQKKRSKRSEERRKERQAPRGFSVFSGREKLDPLEEAELKLLNRQIMKAKVGSPPKDVTSLNVIPGVIQSPQTDKSRIPAKRAQTAAKNIKNTATNTIDINKEFFSNKILCM